MSEADAAARAQRVLAAQRPSTRPLVLPGVPGVTPADVERDEHETVGTGLGAAAASFCFFASGAIIPIVPFLFGLSGVLALVIAAVLVGLALLGTGAVVGLLSGAPPLARALRQLAIGFGAAAATYLLGLLFGTSVA